MTTTKIVLGPFYSLSLFSVLFAVKHDYQTTVQIRFIIHEINCTSLEKLLMSVKNCSKILESAFFPTIVTSCVHYIYGSFFRLLTLMPCLLGKQHLSLSEYPDLGLKNTFI